MSPNMRPLDVPLYVLGTFDTDVPGSIVFGLQPKYVQGTYHVRRKLFKCLLGRFESSRILNESYVPSKQVQFEIYAKHALKVLLLQRKMFMIHLAFDKVTLMTVVRLVEIVRPIRFWPGPTKITTYNFFRTVWLWRGYRWLSTKYGWFTSRYR